MVTSSHVRYSKTALFALALLVLIAASLTPAPVAAHFPGFSVWYGNRTATAVTVYWTIRHQEDALNTGADTARVCWVDGTSSCSNDVWLSQNGSVNSVNSYLITDLTCANTYSVSVRQSYVLYYSWDWETVSTQVPPCA